MESTLQAVIRSGRLPATGLLVVGALIAWRASATVAQTPEPAPRLEEALPPANPGPAPSATEVLPATPGGEGAPAAIPLPTPAGSSAPSVSNPVESEFSGVPRGVLSPGIIAIEITPDADQSEFIREALKTLDQSGTKIIAADPLQAGSRPPLMAVVGVKPQASSAEIVRLVQTLQKRGVQRFSISLTQAERSSVIVVAPADASWRTVHTLLEELKKHAKFDVDVRVAANNDPLTPTVPLGEPLPLSPLPAGPPSVGAPTPFPIAPSPPPQPGSLPPGLEPSPNPIVPSAPSGGLDSPLPLTETRPQIPGPSGLLPQPEPSPNIFPSPPAGEPSGGAIPSLESPPTDVGPGLTPGGPPFAIPGAGPPTAMAPLAGGPSRNQPLKVFVLEHAPATDVGRIVQQLYGSRINLALDERTNSLLVNGYDAEVMVDLEGLLKVLDVPGRRSNPNGNPAASPFDPAMLPPGGSGSMVPGGRGGRSIPNPGSASMGPPTPAPQPGSPSDVASGPAARRTPSELIQKLAPADTGELPAQIRGVLGRFFGPNATEGEGTGSIPRGPAEIPYWHGRVEDLALRQSAQLRQTPPEQRDPALLRELRSLVLLQFHLRQLQQRAELAEFARRLERIGESIETREQIAGRIVDRRVEELLDPALTWNQPAPMSPLPADNPNPYAVRPGSSANGVVLPGSERSGTGVVPRSPNEVMGPDPFRSEATLPNPLPREARPPYGRTGGAPAASQPKASTKAKPSVGVQFDLGKPPGEFQWIEGRGGMTSSGRGKTIQASCGARLRLRMRGLPKHADENVFLTIEVQEEKVLEASRVIETVATNSLPLRITDEDLDQVFSNNLVTKVIYRPHDLSKTGESLFDTIVSFRLDPGADPRTEAEKRGTVVATIRLSQTDEAPAAEVRELPSRKASAAPGTDAEMQTIPDLSLPLRSDAEKGVARIVLVFATNEVQRGLPVLLVNVGGKTLAMVAAPATIVPDGTNPTLDRAFLEIPDRPPVAVTYNPKWQDPKREFYVFECGETLPGQPLEVPPSLDAGETLSAILPGSESEFRVTPDAARIRAIGSSATWLVPTTQESTEHSGLWELDRALPEGTLLFRSGQLAGVTFLGTRFLGGKGDKSYVVPAQRLMELQAKLAVRANKESDGTPAEPPADPPQDPASAQRQ